MTDDQREAAYNAKREGIRILKRGTPPEKKIYNIECRRCQSILEFERESAETHPDGRGGFFLSISCPVCKAFLSVDVYD